MINITHFEEVEAFDIVFKRTPNPDKSNWINTKSSMGSEFNKSLMQMNKTVIVLFQLPDSKKNNELIIIFIFIFKGIKLN